MRLWIVICICCMHTIRWREAEGLPWPEGAGNSLGLPTIPKEIIGSQLDAEQGGRKSGIDSSNTDEMTTSITEMSPNIGETTVTVAGFNDSEIDEETVAVLYPDWVRQTRSLDANTGKTMISVVNRDESEIVRSVKHDFKYDWTVKTRSVDLENDRVTLTYFFHNGSSLILELNRSTETVRETVHSSDGTTIIRRVDSETGIELVNHLYPDGNKKEVEISQHDGFERRGVTWFDGSHEFWKTNLTTGYSNVLIFFSNLTLGIVKTHPKFGIKNVTLVFPDGRKEIRSFNLTNGAEILELGFPNGTSTSEVIDERIDEDFVDFLDPLWTRKVKEVDPESGDITLTIYSSDGTHTRRRVKEPCKNYLFGDCEWIETIRQINSTTGIPTIIQVASDGSKKVLVFESRFTTVTYYDKDGIAYHQGRAERLFTQVMKCLPGYVPARNSCKKNVDLFGSETAEKMMSTMETTPKIDETTATVA